MVEEFYFGGEVPTDARIVFVVIVKIGSFTQFAGLPVTSTSVASFGIVLAVINQSMRGSKHLTSFLSTS